MSHSRHASSSSYNPVLINPHSHYQGQSRSSSHSRPPSLKIKYPFPLFLLSILDLFLTLYNSGNPSVLVAFCTSRFVVLGLVVGFSRHWRDRGGYVALVDGFSVGYVVWTTCKRQLERGKTGPEDGDSQHEYMILALTVLMSFIEYFTFLLLLRLSPPPHKSNPLALRLPNSTVQTAQPFNYHTSSTTSLTNPTTPSNSKTRHYRHSSKTSLLHPPTAYSEYTDSATDSMTEDEEDDGEDDEGVDSDYSSISESSIIDLPPPLTPSRILPQRLNANVNRGLEVLGVVSDSAEAIGAVVRRSRSARFLRRSFGSGSRIEDEDDQDDREARGRYGTFGIDDQSTR